MTTVQKIKEIEDEVRPVNLMITGGRGHYAELLARLWMECRDGAMEQGAWRSDVVCEMGVCR